MVDKKISELPEAATLTGLEELPAVQGPDTVRVSIQEIANLASGAPSALIYETVLNALAESVTISVPAGHGDLELVVVGRATASADTDLRMTFNGDTGNNYDSIRENRFGSTSYTDTSYISFAQIAGANSPSNVITSIHARIFAYDSSQFHKSVIIQASTKFPSYTGLQSVTGHWESVSPITSIAIEAPGTTFVTGTIFRLYGKKAVSYVPTTIAALSDVDFVPAPTNSQVLTYNSTTSKWEPISLAFDANMFFPGSYSSNQILARILIPKNMKLLSGLSGSFSSSTVAATSTTAISILKNASSIGSIEFAAGGTTGSFTFASDVTFAPGDILSIVAPSSPDATLSNVSLTLSGVRI